VYPVADKQSNRTQNGLNSKQVVPKWATSEYVKNQEQYQTVKAFKYEYIELLQEHNIEFDEKYIL